MALTESTETDKIEVVGALYRTVQIRKATVIKKDGVVKMSAEL